MLFDDAAVRAPSEHDGPTSAVRVVPEPPGHADRTEKTTVWPALSPGTALTVVKLAPDGSEVTRYPGRVITAAAPPPWLVVEARWVNRRVDLDGLAFVPGDTLHEFFSPVDRFNVFAVIAPDGSLRGWYANVTHPTALDLDTDPPNLVWHDLFLDVVALPNGPVTVRDEDELAEANLATADPVLYAAIVETRDDILRRVAAGGFPFHQEGNKT
jgi:hypothetical protein